MRNKYNAKKTRYGDKTYDSKLEMMHAHELRMLQKGGKISNLQEQVNINLCLNSSSSKKYIVDFAYFDNTDKEWVLYETKGMSLEPYLTKRAWLLDVFNGFVFIERKAKKTTKFYPSGDVDLINILLKNKKLFNNENI